MLTPVEKCWLWAAVHHKDFHKCTITFNPAPVSIGINFGRYCAYEIASIDIRLLRPELCLDIPFHIYIDYVEAMKKHGIYLDAASFFNDIPF